MTCTHEVLAWCMLSLEMHHSGSTTCVLSVLQQQLWPHTVCALLLLVYYAMWMVTPTMGLVTSTVFTIHDMLWTLQVHGPEDHVYGSHQHDHVS